MAKQKSEWKRMRFKTNKVWVAITPEGHFLEKNGKVLMKYQIDQDYEYWVHKSSIKSLDTDNEKENAGKSADKKSTPKQEGIESENESHPSGTIIIYTDGASSGNPGPSGIGILLCFGDHEKEISEYIGSATNNIAELEAIRTGLLAVKKRDLPVRIYTDSNYALGVLTQGWKIKKNDVLIRSIQKIMSSFKNIELVKVKGHANIVGNERADKLATAAIHKRK